ncbi:hypothetical protein E2C01_044456 [Portunus trituberculatus]|uniref:Uncharacterized protein n=1 Tax=Portunus trituberculatus TaxID=210409 RepID=A0A5B7FZ35_PORTR|nr:hypothetical protein [Portunus trituberculatus]
MVTSPKGDSKAGFGVAIFLFQIVFPELLNQKYLMVCTQLHAEYLWINDSQNVVSLLAEQDGSSVQTLKMIGSHSKLDFVMETNKYEFRQQVQLGELNVTPDVKIEDVFTTLHGSDQERYSEVTTRYSLKAIRTYMELDENELALIGVDLLKMRCEDLSGFHLIAIVHSLLKIRVR